MKTKIIFIVCFSLICIGLFSWTWPLSNSSAQDTFTSAFGPRDKYDTPGLQYDFHRGMDLEETSFLPFSVKGKWEKGTLKIYNEEWKM